VQGAFGTLGRVCGITTEFGSGKGRREPRKEGNVNGGGKVSGGPNVRLDREEKSLDGIGMLPWGGEEIQGLWDI